MKTILKIGILQLIILFFVKASAGVYSIDSILKNIRNYSDVQKMDTLNNLCWKIQRTNLKDALALCNTALSISEKKNLHKQRATSLNYTGVLYQKLGVLDSALINYNKASILAKKTNNLIELGYAYNNLGDYYFELALYPLALENILEAHRIFSKINQKIGLAYTLSNLGDIYIKQELYDRALDSLTVALKIRQAFQDDFRVSITQRKIASIYIIQKKYDKALEFYNQLKIANQSKNYPVREAMISEGISDIFYAKQNYKDALVHLKDAINIFRKVNRLQAEINALNKLGLIYIALKQYTLAKECLNSSEKLATATNNKDGKLTNYKNQATLAEAVEDYKNAFKYDRLYTGLRDSIYSATNQKHMLELFSNYENLKLIQERNDWKNLIRWLITAVFTLISFTIYLLYQRQKSKLINKELAELNQSKDKFFSILSHDLKEPLVDLMGLSTILDKNYGIFKEQKIKEMTKVMRISTQEVFGLLNRLLDWSRATTGRIPYNPISFPIYKEVDNVLRLMANMAKSKDIYLVSEIDTTHKVKADPNMVNTIIRNLVSNAIKFTPDKGKIALFSTKKDNNINISVVDSGIGISKTEINQVLRIDVRHSKLGTNNEKGTGVGLALCTELVKTNKGKLWIESKPGKGTKFYFSLPLSD